MERLKVETLYTMKEIEIATGISYETLCSRRRRLGTPANPDGYSMEEVKRMIKRPKRGRPCSPKKAEALKRMLQNDGAI